MPSQAKADMFARFMSTAPTASARLSTLTRMSYVASSAGSAKQSLPSSQSKSSSLFSSSASATSSATGTRPSSFPVPPAPPNETPQEKVARLRAASRRAKAAASTSFLERTISRGRLAADIAHRVVTYTLIGLAGVSTVLAVYASISLFAYHRRQKSAWIDRELQRLQEAREAFVRGEATAEQLHILQQERAGDEMDEQAAREKERKRRESWWRKGLAAVGWENAMDAEGGARAAIRADDEESEPKGKDPDLSDEDAARYGRVSSGPAQSAS